MASITCVFLSSKEQNKGIADGQVRRWFQKEDPYALPLNHGQSHGLWRQPGGGLGAVWCGQTQAVLPLATSTRLWVTSASMAHHIPWMPFPTPSERPKIHAHLLNPWWSNVLLTMSFLVFTVSHIPDSSPNSTSSHQFSKILIPVLGRRQREGGQSPFIPRPTAATPKDLRVNH